LRKLKPLSFALDFNDCPPQQIPLGDRIRRLAVKLFRKTLLPLFLALLATFAVVQTNLSQYVQHVIVIVQENRTPTNLFQQDSTLISRAASRGHTRWTRTTTRMNDPNLKAAGPGAGYALPPLGGARR
jgi:hypothetical protein